MIKQKAGRNKTITLSDSEKAKFKKQLMLFDKKQVEISSLINRVINQDYFEAIKKMPDKFIDLAFIDPPYNLTKSFNGNTFKEMSSEKYSEWVKSWLQLLVPKLKDDASLYICGDWKTSSILYEVGLQAGLFPITRITFARDKGRGSTKFWKNNSEDIWLFSKSKNYCFNAEAVKTRKKVIAPYRSNGKPKDWVESEDGNFRLTYASNIWTDITIPFWSMPENTPHPTQKPEKILAKIILASSNENDVVFDGFAGVGTTGVVAKKLNRKFVMIEQEEEYCLYALKRLEMAETQKRIQGYKDGYFLERNA
ncbi:MAG: site-specific DNA-methyltransferase [Melioribacteraceae bacterium]